MCRTLTWLGCPPDLAEPSASKGVLLHGVFPVHAVLLVVSWAGIPAPPHPAESDGGQH